MIKIGNICKNFGNKQILHNINLDFYEGKIYVIKGVSGCGKTTLLNILAGIDGDNYEGSFYHFNSDIKNSKFKRSRYRRKVGYITQQSLLCDKMTVKENLLFINNNEKLVEHYLQVFGLIKIANRFPSQISGGERQRIAIIRAILCESEIILADEPTSALDKKNSMAFVDEIKRLKRAERIIIICTHKNIFDDIADEIINLDYGRTESNVVDNNNEFYWYVDKKKSSVKNRFLMNKNILYCNRRTNVKRVALNTFILGFIMALLYVSVALYLKYNDEYTKIYAKNHPIEMIEVSRTDLDGIGEYIDYELKDNYIIEESTYVVYTLYDKEESAFIIPGSIKVGKFPQSDKEVIATKKYVEDVLGIKNIKLALGRKIYIKEDVFVISAVIDDDYKELYNVLQSNCYYPNEIGNYIFMPYNSISKIGNNITDVGDYVMIKINKDLYNKKEYINLLTKKYFTYFDTWQHNIDSKTCTIKYYLKTLFMGIIALSIIGIILVGTHINLDLFYRKRELGYLQIFGVNKKRMLFIVFWEYFSKILYALAFAIIVYVLDVLVIKSNTGMLFTLPISLLVYIILGILVYSCLIIIIPMIKYFRENIVMLIKD